MRRGSAIKNALDGAAEMRYSVYVSGRTPLAYYSPAGLERVLTGFYNKQVIITNSHTTIALPEMTGFYNQT